MRGHDLFRYAAVAATVACYAAILLGGNVMASDSGLACPDWPTCTGSLLGPTTGAPGIEWAHRLSALVLSLVIGAMAVLGLLYERSRPVVLRLSVASAVLVVLQAILGGVVVDSNLLIAAVLLHLGLATVLFGLLLLIVLLANLREIPRRWVDWAWRATEERAPAPPSEAGADGRLDPRPSPGVGGLAPPG